MQISYFAKNKKSLPIVTSWASAILVNPLDDRPEEFGWVFINEDKWFEGPAAAGVLGVTISEDVGTSTKNGTEGSYHAICSSFFAVN